MKEIKLFNGKNIRTAWNDSEEDWYFAVVDIIGALTDSADPRNYWKVLKSRLKKEGNETVTSCNRLKFTAADGKARLTDALSTKGVLRLVQSVPSPKAEPFKLWLAEVGNENGYNDPIGERR